ncbi:MAG: DUF4301 family protein [Bacteroidia bacterium]|nr:DUF4301 family protein [Bacteroidia bacterium]
MLTNEDVLKIEKRGSSKERVESQLKKFETGFPYLEIVAPATPDKGISVLSKEEQFSCVKRYSKFEGSVTKFVPASGAATRMFKDLFEAMGALDKGQEMAEKANSFFEELDKYPFYGDLQDLFSYDIVSNKDVRSRQIILESLLTEVGLGYGSLPKGLIKFHKYDNYVRTALEEHLSESAGYGIDKRGFAKLVFTVSQEHLPLFRSLVQKIRSQYEKNFKYSLDISFTLQKPSTDTIAVDMENRPFKESNGELLFRPAGHGALIENLNDIDSDLVFIKNIDNVTREELTIDTVWWKKVLAGHLLGIQSKVFGYLEQLNGERVDGLNKIIKSFIEETFCMQLPNVDESIEKEYLTAILDRPLRVCGMVKNLGEPGGGPFLVRDADGSVSLQILEGAQLDMSDLSVVEIVADSTHFNPVDLVCSIKDYRGNKFDLSKFTDPETGFISEKSVGGVSIKALEMPGLWNGAMSRWNTVFVEVPITTFSPVKTVFDLLRPEHQG